MGKVMWKNVPAHRLDSSPTPRGVWGALDPLFSPKAIERFLYAGIKEKYWGFDVEKINSGRKAFKDLNFTHKFIEPSEVPKLAEQVVYYCSQAKDYFYSADSASVVTKPTLLYYGLVSLGKGVITSVYGEGGFGTPVFRGHGLEVSDESPTEIRTRILRKGEFQFLHDAICEETEIYNSQDLFEFRLKDLFGFFPHIRPEFELGVYGKISVDPKNNRAKSSRVSYLDQAALIKSVSGKDFTVQHEDANLHIIDAHAITLFTLSYLARYRAPLWRTLLDSELGITIRAYLEYSALSVPMHFYSEISGMETYFLPMAYLS